MSARPIYIHHYYSIACSKCARVLRVLRSHLRHTSVSHVVDTGTRECCCGVELWAKKKNRHPAPSKYFGL
jgi:hypothetical protein